MPRLNLHCLGNEMGNSFSVFLIRLKSDGKYVQAMKVIFVNCIEYL